MERVQSDMGGVSSLRIAGEVEQDDATRGLDLALDEDGNYEGTFSIDGVDAEVLIVDYRLFVRGEEEFWTQTGLAADSQMAGSFDGKWVELPGGPQPGNEAAGIGGMCDLESFLAEITEADWDSVSKGETTEIDGTQALELIAVNDWGTTRMWVSTGEDNHVLKLVREGSEPDDFTLDDYNEPVDVSVPDEDEILDLAGAGNGLSACPAQSVGGESDDETDC